MRKTVLAKDHAATAAMMQAMEGFNSEDVALAAATLLAQCCLVGSDSISEAFRILADHYANMKSEMRDNVGIGRFPLSN
jgi:hypothetical protein